VLAIGVTVLALLVLQGASLMERVLRR